jgi:hypothetical protein
MKELQGNKLCSYICKRSCASATIRRRYNSEKHEKNYRKQYTNDDAMFSMEMHTWLNGTTSCLYYYQTKESE